MKKYLIPLVLLIVLVIGACTQAAPEPTAPVVEEPAAEEPTAEPTPVPTEEPEPTDMPPSTIVDLAVADGRFTTLVAALEAAELVETLQGEGPFTVFAPTDDAFAKLPEGTVEALLADIPTLTSILLYHVVAGEFKAADVTELSYATTVNGEDVLIKVTDAGVFVNDAQVIITDIIADNGVIHVLDTVILPPSADIIDTAVADGRFTTLAAALEAAGLIDTLKGDGPFTVFAPTDDAFAALPAGTVEALLADIPALTDILLYHVAEGVVPAADVVELSKVPTLQGKKLDVTLPEGMVYLDNAQVIITDILTTNGVIHVIDAVMVPQPDIVEVAVADGRFTTLAAALEAADLIDTLKGDGPFTVFAPTDDAFGKLPEGTVEALLADIPALTEILLYHVVAGEVKAEQVVELNFATTVNGQDVLVKASDAGVFINDAQVIITDVPADNGVIHVIDTVILPPAADIVDTAVADGRFTTLAAALEAAGLIDTLKGEGPFTVFAPTDAAFAKLPEGTVEALLEDIPTLTSILLYHVAEGRALAADVVELPYVETINGAPALIQVNDQGVFLNGAQVIITNILTTNGVIHVIDTVILPPSADIIDTAVADGRFTTLAAALEAADLIDTLKGEGPFTVFAPTDDAFAKLPEGTVEALLNDIPTLTNILLYHVSDGRLLSGDVEGFKYVDMLNGQELTLKITADGVFIGQSQIIILDLLTSNGVIHVIDAVLLPPAQ
ncbi:MAG: fasciclin domain-containing protein [Anaerolineae bacterium]|nr:fasciclin domain-containing protein [Anaerolineae bacterium]